MIISLIIAVVLFAVVLYWDVNSDYKKIQEGRPIQHTKEMVIRSLLLTPSAILFVTSNFSLIIIPVVIFMIGAWWWEFFDGFLNMKRGYPWRYNGSEDSDDAQADNILQSLSPLKQAILKWTLITLFTTLYILLP